MEKVPLCTMANKTSPELSKDVWSRLLRGKTLDDLGLPKEDNRTVLEGLESPDPLIIKSLPQFGVNLVNNRLIIENVMWRNLHFKKSRLNHVHFMRVDFSNCIFQESHCKQWGLWYSRISHCAFQKVNLRGAVLGSCYSKRNEYTDTTFANSDLRDVINLSSRFVGCSFINNNLMKAAMSSSYIECKFEGELREAEFNWNNDDKDPDIEYTNLDLSKAKLRHTMFRKINLDKIRLPEDDEHVIIYNYKAALDRLIEAMKLKGDVKSRSIAAYFGFHRKWLHPDQTRGYVSREELKEVLGEEDTRMIIEILTQQH